MSSYPGIKYFIHDSSVYLVPRYTNTSDLAVMLNSARKAAYKCMMESNSDHAVYGVKHYAPDTGVVVKADIYAPAVLLDEVEFIFSTRHRQDVVCL